MKNRKKCATGGKIGEELAGVQGLPDLLTAITSMLTDKPTYDSQPLVTGQALRNMKTPYSAAYGLDLGGGGGKKRKSKAVKDAEDINIPSVNYRNGMQFTGTVDENGVSVEDPTQAQWLDTMIKYALNNNPDSNVYRDAFQHHSIVDKPIVPVGAYGLDTGEPIKPPKEIKKSPVRKVGNRLNETPITFTPYQRELLKAENSSRSGSSLKIVNAYGGDIGTDLDDGDLEQLQAIADEQGISVEELVQQMQAQQGGDEEESAEEDMGEGGEEDEGEYGMGGVIKKGYGMGGVPIEAEGGEVMQTPNGDLKEIVGASHEQGGVDINVPKGSRIYSDRLSIDGKTMQQRKKAREGRLNKMNKALGINPSDVLTKNSIARTTEINDVEEEQDMAFQKLAAKIYDAPTKKAAYGLDGEEEDPFTGLRIQAGIANNAINGSTPLYYGPGTRYMPNTITAPRAIGTTVGSLPSKVPSLKVGAPDAIPDDGDLGFTTGDLIGMGGNLFNAIAPILNTKNAQRNTRPVINRFKGFGRDALDTNTFAQDYVAGQKGSELGDLESSVNAQVASARNSARSINTQRALESVIGVNRNKAKNAINTAATNKMLAILGQRTQLENMRDAREMQGQTAADTANDMNLDNYYTNMAQNLTNAGTNIEGLGRNLNVTQSNIDDADLIAMQAKNLVKIGRKKRRFNLLNR